MFVIPTPRHTQTDKQWEREVHPLAIYGLWRARCKQVVWIDVSDWRSCGKQFSINAFRLNQIISFCLFYYIFIAWFSLLLKYHWKEQHQKTNKQRSKRKNREKKYSTFKFKILHRSSVCEYFIKSVDNYVLHLNTTLFYCTKINWKWL